MINIGMAAITATTRRNTRFLCSFRYISRATWSEEGGCQIETEEMGVDIAVEIVDITVRIVK